MDSNHRSQSGHGLAIGRRPVVDDRLVLGTLVAPFGAGDPTGAAHYLCRVAGTTDPTRRRLVVKTAAARQSPSDGADTRL
jgi:hypothetical protein